MMATPLGRIFILLESVTAGLEFQTDKERDEFLTYIGDTLDVNLKQKLLTWRANRNQPRES